MPADLKYLEGRRFCVVLIKLDDETRPDGPFKMRCMHGRASIDHQGYLTLEGESSSWKVPSACYSRILPSDGKKILEDAEYFVLCRVSGIDL
jgi:hypothetical protein